MSLGFHLLPCSINSSHSGFIAVFSTYQTCSCSQGLFTYSSACLQERLTFGNFWKISSPSQHILLSFPCKYFTYLLIYSVFDSPISKDSYLYSLLSSQYSQQGLSHGGCTNNVCWISISQMLWFIQLELFYNYFNDRGLLSGPTWLMGPEEGACFMNTTVAYMF